MITRRTNKAMFITDTFLTTSTAILRSIMRINIDNRDANFNGFIFNKVLKLIERPRMYKEFLLLLGLNSISYVFKVFHNKNVIKLAIINNSFTDAVISIGHPTSFSTGEMFQSAFGRLRAFSLETFAKFRIMFSGVHDLSTRESLPLVVVAILYNPLSIPTGLLPEGTTTSFSRTMLI